MMEGPLIDFGEPIAGNRTPYYGYGEGFAQSRPAVAASGPNHAGVGSDKNGGLDEIDFTRTITDIPHFEDPWVGAGSHSHTSYMAGIRSPMDVDDRPSIDLLSDGPNDVDARIDPYQNRFPALADKFRPELSSSVAVRPVSVKNERRPSLYRVDEDFEVDLDDMLPEDTELLERFVNERAEKHSRFVSERNQAIEGLKKRLERRKEKRTPPPVREERPTAGPSRTKVQTTAEPSDSEMKYSETPVKQEHAQGVSIAEFERLRQERDRAYQEAESTRKSFQFMVEENNRLEAEVVRRRYRAEQQVPREPQVREDRSVRFEEPKERTQPHSNPQRLRSGIGEAGGSGAPNPDGRDRRFSSTEERTRSLPGSSLRYPG